jgi:hypothetical protein
MVVTASTRWLESASSVWPIDSPPAGAPHPTHATIVIADAARIVRFMGGALEHRLCRTG